MLDTLLGYFLGSPLAFWGLFLVLVLCGIGVPIPEDIILIAAGILSYEESRSWIKVSVLMYAGVMAGDSLIFVIGRHFGSRLLAHRWTRRMFSPTKQAKIEAKFERYGRMVLFVARFLPGLRAPIFCTAGAMKVPYLRFLLLDGIAALFTVPLFVWLGHWLWAKFHDDVEQLEAALARTHSYSLLVTLGIVVTAVIIGVWLRRRSRSTAPIAELPPEDSKR